MKLLDRWNAKSTADVIKILGECCERSQSYQYASIFNVASMAKQVAISPRFFCAFMFAKAKLGIDQRPNMNNDIDMLNEIARHGRFHQMEGHEQISRYTAFHGEKNTLSGFFWGRKKDLEHNS